MRLFGEVLVTMLVILDPPGNVPIFLAVTRRLSEKERHRAAFLAVGTAFFVISMFAIGGQTVLDYLNVSVPALQGAGGLLLLLVALQLLYGKGEAEDAYEIASPEQRTQLPWSRSEPHCSLAPVPSLPQSSSSEKPKEASNGSVLSSQSHAHCPFR